VEPATNRNDQPVPLGARPLHPAWRSRRAWILLITIALAATAVDLASKWIAFRTVADAPVAVSRQDVLSTPPGLITDRLVPDHEPVIVIPHVLEFRLVLNPGAVFGIGAGQRWFFVGFTAVALAFGLWMFARWTSARDASAHIAIGLVISGGLGNLYDRLRFGCVRDFIHPLPGVKFPFGWRPLGPSGEVWPYISNVADLALLIGIGMLLVFLWRRDRD
jgi:signal peptidase II